MTLDPVATNPDHYSVVFQNDVVRVLQYEDAPGDRTTPHDHPNSVMITQSGFRRRLTSPTGSRDVELPSGAVVWLSAQQHFGENIGETPTRVLLVELLTSQDHGGSDLGPSLPQD